MFEHRAQPLLHHRAFLSRLGKSLLFGLALIVLSLALGMVGFHTLAGYGWIDSFLSASMLLSGMGPLDDLAQKSDVAKVFAGLYALYSGIAVLGIAGVIFAPLLHRLLHRFHLEGSEHSRPARKERIDPRHQP